MSAWLPPGGEGLQCERGETKLVVAQPLLIPKRYQRAMVTLAELMVMRMIFKDFKPDQQKASPLLSYWTPSPCPGPIKSNQKIDTFAYYK